MAGLTVKQQVFVEEYLTCWNATEAARRAKYAYPNIDGPKNLVKPSIQKVIKARLAEKAMPADEVLARLAEQAKADMRDFMLHDAEGKFIGVNLDTTQPLHLIKKLKPTRYGMAIELHDAHAALTLLAKHHGLLQDIDLSKLSEIVIKALAEGIGISDIRRITTESKA